eukprot:TRINITY_DN29538_c0_g3_i1.p3 TRINITY_DN29538_c0_g3~~TRINITY_DN29538_c0_g3_i1.p3  ORF type:complete len:101 (-),score=4.43 TRINITY_DN29538_c0_g3_i1:285-587(-)
MLAFQTLSRNFYQFYGGQFHCSVVSSFFFQIYKRTMDDELIHYFIIYRRYILLYIEGTFFSFSTTFFRVKLWYVDNFVFQFLNFAVRRGGLYFKNTLTTL